VIQHPAFPAEPWTVRETSLDLEHLAQTESLFALANGHIGLRANLDEGEPFGLPGTYLAGFYELRPLPYTEAGYGDPEVGQSIVNVTNGKIIRLLVEDEPFDIRYGTLEHHERVLDLRAGLLRRDARWRSPTGRLVRVSSTRLVSFSERAVAAICYEVEPLETNLRIVVQSELVANESVPAREKDPRAAAALAQPLRGELHVAHDQGALLIHVTKESGLRIGAAMDHAVTSPTEAEVSVEHLDDLARVTVIADVAPKHPLRVVKFLAYGWSAQRSIPAIRDQVRAALASARRTGWEGLLAEQRAYLDDFWDGADVEIEGDAELQQAVRFALFHTLQAGARGEERAIPAKGLTGPGYDGHTFWDTEIFVLPVLTNTVPRAAADALRWRHRTLALARQRAKALGLRGAAFPWRTISGEECSSYWPAGTAAFHINADIADAVIRYQSVTGDGSFEHDVGLELLVETARLWRSLGHFDEAGRFRIDGVTGPDEYSALADNNVYTNLMAQRNLRAAAAAADRNPKLATTFGVDPKETATWRDAAEAVIVPYDERLGVHPQAEGYTEHEVWDFEATPPEQYPLMLHFPYFSLYRKQVVKQADLVLALQLRGDVFSQDEKARDFAYYERLTVRDSSLSACTQAVIAAELGHLRLAYDYLCESALLDLEDLQHDTRDGVHIASLAGTWIAIVFGFGGVREHDGSVAFAPRLPPALHRIAFRLSFRERRLLVDIGRETASYSLLGGPKLSITHHGEAATLVANRPLVLAIPPPPRFAVPTQPRGRAPARRRPRS
jgi:alpha,alpha-trehalose phosphorylase